MIIKAKPIPKVLFLWSVILITKIFRRRFNKLLIEQVNISPGHSFLLMCNHFSFLDGILAAHLCLNGIHKKQKMNGFYVMVLKKQVQKNRWMRYFGAFSISPYSRTAEESLNYAAEILSVPGNLLLIYPQGNLESSHIRKIEFKAGISEIIPRIKGDCQLIWCSNIMEYFESTKPSVYFNMLDCGTNHDFNFGQLKEKVNDHHLKALKKTVRFTEEREN